MRRFGLVLPSSTQAQGVLLQNNKALDGDDYEGKKKKKVSSRKKNFFFFSVALPSIGRLAWKYRQEHR